MLRQLKISPSITNRDERAVQSYLQDISRIPLLDPEEECAVCQRIKQGDKQALDTLVRANLRFVVTVAKQYQNRGLPLSDLINEGNLGLIKAAQRYDETRGLKFISYGVWWIRQSITYALNEHVLMVSIPLNKQKIVTDIMNVENAFMQEYEYLPSEEEIAAELDIPIKHVRSGKIVANGKHVSLDAMLTDFDGEHAPILLDTMVCAEKNPEEISELKSTQERIQNILKAFITNDREYHILASVFGIDGYEKLSLQQIARKMGLTTERTRQLKEAAVRRLKKSPKAERLLLSA